MKLLFICTHNRCRSILCEAITNHLSHGKVTAYSAGSQPAGKIHPLTLEHLKAHNIERQYLQSQSWGDFEGVEFDAVITVCDNAANESCPIWLGDNSTKLQWGLPDPSKTALSPEQSYQGFTDLINVISTRINMLLAQDIKHINQNTLTYIFQAISLEIEPLDITQ